MLTRDFQGDLNRPFTMEINHSEIDIFNSSPKRWYREMVKEARPAFTRAESWRRDLNNDNLLREDTWNNIFSLPFKTSRETKLQSFGFKLANRLTPCGKYLHKIRVREDPCCLECGNEDTIVHFFLSCPLARNFWNKLANWCDSHINLSFAQLSETEYILGVTRKMEGKQLINGLLLTAKFYIQKRRLFHKADFSLLAFLAETRSRLQTEKTVCLMTGRERAFRPWRGLLNALT